MHPDNKLQSTCVSQIIVVFCFFSLLLLWLNLFILNMGYPAILCSYFAFCKKPRKTSNQDFFYLLSS